MGDSWRRNRIFDNLKDSPPNIYYLWSTKEQLCSGECGRHHISRWTSAGIGPPRSRALILCAEKGSSSLSHSSPKSTTWIYLTVRKHQTQIQGHSTKYLTSTLQNCQGPRRPGKTEEWSHTGDQGPMRARCGVWFWMGSWTLTRTLTSESSV